MNEKLKVDEMGRLGVSDFRAAAKFPLTIVLDNVRSVHNVGSVFRTADAFRLREVMLCGITAVPPSPEMHKTALGAEDSVDWRHFDATADALAELRERGVKVCVLEQCRRSVALQDFIFEPGSEYAITTTDNGASLGTAINLTQLKSIVGDDFKIVNGQLYLHPSQQAEAVEIVKLDADSLVAKGTTEVYRLGKQKH